MTGEQVERELSGDGSGEALPPFDPTRERVFSGDAMTDRVAPEELVERHQAEQTGAWVGEKWVRGAGPTLCDRCRSPWPCPEARAAQYITRLEGEQQPQ